ncbi:UDP-N-acetylmuramoylalanine--D-glutamate ligase [Thermolongibacillus altinsuensis]|uniref:UDP-N-acetylmuramoylalanine--D-glutamate ligase n=1 Tax=Thermolongibacillus altinsuensis TaxID=575256 RepID=A0A4R1QMS7_9BACL|nr:UDP-N-acetylmuramoyl-L-alanine--D-glutamate ligase [Thermolongibacillus altinsuensis]TCL50279.1 UDP-N-acetylmuramoylalanine--D-glutamate ligase [Thermolongibacillus altinsuensis]GMB08553.1 UDP-N-acetylmuramoylalanine--D-glutamate ligase [Thermolongibacillus altinsuensis]
MMYKQKNVLVLGLAKSGFAAAKLLHELGANVTVNDQKPLSENEEARVLEALGIRLVCGSHPLELLDEPFDIMVKNPGIPYSNPMVQKALQKQIPIITEVEIAYHLSKAPIIGITGSNGKTTTTTLIYEMLQAAKRRPLIAGNIGTVACEVAKNTRDDQVMVMELSSFQLMGTIEFRPHIAVLLNIFDAHLDYHGTKEAYAAAKGNIFKNQTESDYAIVNADDELVMKLAEDGHATKVFFSTTKQLNKGAYIKDEAIYFNNEKVIDISQIALRGKHNLENILAAISAAKLAGADNDAIQHVLTTFTGVAHRLQFVADINGRKFYNDSKATNILATQKALSAFENERVILLAGGLDRGNEFDELIPYLKHVKAMITFGQTASKLERVAREAGIETIKRVDNVEQAAFVAYELSERGDIILLSPACASWDQYKTFEQRGDMFVNAVHKLK